MKKIFKLKTIQRIAGIIALVAIIGFSFAACGGDDGTAPIITTATLPNGVVNKAYSQALAATGDAPITWSIESGTLPIGLSFAEETGVISGTPTVAGTFTFTVKAINSAGNNTKSLSITITNTDGTGGGDSSSITVTGFPKAAEGAFGFIVLSKTQDFEIADIVGVSAAAKVIAAGSLVTDMSNLDGSAFGENDIYYVTIGVGKDEASAKANALGQVGTYFVSDSKVVIVKGPENTIDLKKFSPPAVIYWGTATELVKEIFLGTYSTEYTSPMGNKVREYIDFGGDTFSIYEKDYFGVKSTTDFIDFKIDKPWEYISVPVAYAAVYDRGLKFTGCITDGKPVTAQNGDTPKYIYGNKTAPNFDGDDITNKTTATMNVYFNTVTKTFIRTAFSKEGSDQSAIIITGNETPTNLPRVYRKY